jgi:hypothetical protein
VKTAYVLLLSVLLVAGCKKDKPPAPSNDFGPDTAAPVAAPAASPEALRDALLAAEPSLKVGIINGVDLSNMSVTVGGVNEADFKAGDTLSLNDLTQQPIASGVVTAVGGGSVTVRYTVIAGGRPPQGGDLAIKFAK